MFGIQGGEGTYVGCPEARFDDTNTRQIQRRRRFQDAVVELNGKFGGTTDRGGHYYAKGFGRKQVRAAARAMVKRRWQGARNKPLQEAA